MQNIGNILNNIQKKQSLLTHHTNKPHAHFNSVRYYALMFFIFLS